MIIDVHLGKHEIILKKDDGSCYNKATDKVLVGGDIMMYPYMTLNDNTEITHSEMKTDGRVKVYIETPDEKVCFRHATCWLPEYKWEDVYAYSDVDIEKFQEIIESTAHLIMEFSQEGGFDNASNL